MQDSRILSSPLSLHLSAAQRAAAFAPISTSSADPAPAAPQSRLPTASSDSTSPPCISRRLRFAEGVSFSELRPLSLSASSAAFLSPSAAVCFGQELPLLRLSCCSRCSNVNVACELDSPDEKQTSPEAAAAGSAEAAAVNCYCRTITIIAQWTSISTQQGFPCSVVALRVIPAACLSATAAAPAAHCSSSASAAAKWRPGRAAAEALAPAAAFASPQEAAADTESVHPRAENEQQRSYYHVYISVLGYDVEKQGQFRYICCSSTGCYIALLSETACCCSFLPPLAASNYSGKDRTCSHEDVGDACCHSSSSSSNSSARAGKCSFHSSSDERDNDSSHDKKWSWPSSSLASKGAAAVAADDAPSLRVRGVLLLQKEEADAAAVDLSIPHASSSSRRSSAELAVNQSRRSSNSRSCAKVTLQQEKTPRMIKCQFHPFAESSLLLLTHEYLYPEQQQQINSCGSQQKLHSDSNSHSSESSNDDSGYSDSSNCVRTKYGGDKGKGMQGVLRLFDLCVSVEVPEQELLVPSPALSATEAVEGEAAGASECRRCVASSSQTTAAATSGAAAAVCRAAQRTAQVDEPEVKEAAANANREKAERSETCEQHSRRESEVHERLLPADFSFGCSGETVVLWTAFSVLLVYSRFPAFMTSERFACSTSNNRNSNRSEESTFCCCFCPLVPASLLSNPTYKQQLPVALQLALEERVAKAQLLQLQQQEPLSSSSSSKHFAGDSTSRGNKGEKQDATFEMDDEATEAWLLSRSSGIAAVNEPQVEQQQPVAQMMHLDFFGTQQERQIRVAAAAAEAEKQQQKEEEEEVDDASFLFDMSAVIVLAADPLLLLLTASGGNRFQVWASASELLPRMRRRTLSLQEQFVLLQQQQCSLQEGTSGSSGSSSKDRRSSTNNSSSSTCCSEVRFFLLQETPPLESSAAPVKGLPLDQQEAQQQPPAEQQETRETWGAVDLLLLPASANVAANGEVGVLVITAKEVLLLLVRGVHPQEHLRQQPHTLSRQQNTDSSCSIKPGVRYMQQQEGRGFQPSHYCEPPSLEVHVILGLVPFAAGVPGTHFDTPHSSSSRRAPAAAAPEEESHAVAFVCGANIICCSSHPMSTEQQDLQHQYDFQQQQQQQQGEEPAATGEGDIEMAGECSKKLPRHKVFCCVCFCCCCRAAASSSSSSSTSCSLSSSVSAEKPQQQLYRLVVDLSAFIFKRMQGVAAAARDRASTGIIRKEEENEEETEEEVPLLQPWIAVKGDNVETLIADGRQRLTRVQQQLQHVRQQHAVAVAAAEAAANAEAAARSGRRETQENGDTRLARIVAVKIAKAAAAQAVQAADEELLLPLRENQRLLRSAAAAALTRRGATLSFQQQRLLEQQQHLQQQQHRIQERLQQLHHNSQRLRSSCFSVGRLLLEEGRVLRLQQVEHAWHSLVEQLQQLPRRFVAEVEIASFSVSADVRDKKDTSLFESDADLQELLQGGEAMGEQLLLLQKRLQQLQQLIVEASASTGSESTALLPTTSRSDTVRDRSSSSLSLHAVDDQHCCFSVRTPPTCLQQQQKPRTSLCCCFCYCCSSAASTTRSLPVQPLRRRMDISEIVAQYYD